MRVIFSPARTSCTATQTPFDSTPFRLDVQGHLNRLVTSRDAIVMTITSSRAPAVQPLGASHDYRKMTTLSQPHSHRLDRVDLHRPLHARADWMCDPATTIMAIGKPKRSAEQDYRLPAASA